MGNGARGTESSRSGVGVQVRLAGEVGSGCQVRVYCPMAGAVVWERIWGLGKCGCNVGMLSSMAGRSLSVHVLRYLAEIERLLLERVSGGPRLAVGSCGDGAAGGMCAGSHNGRGGG